MTTLRDTLPALSAAVPEIPVQLDAIRGEADALREASAQLLQDVDEKRSRAAALFDEVDAALAALREEGRQARGRLDTTLQDAEGAVDDAREALEQGQAAVSQAADAMASSINALQTDLMEAATAAQESGQQISAALNEIDAAAESGRDGVEEGLDKVTAEAATLAGAVREAQDAAASGADTLRARMRAVLDQARQKIEGVAEALRGLQGEHEAQLAARGDRLSGGARDVAEEVRSRVQAELRDRMDAATGDALEALEELGRAVSDAKDIAKLDAETMAGLFDTLSDAMVPLPAAIDSVRQAADETGIPWN